VCACVDTARQAARDMGQTESLVSNVHVTEDNKQEQIDTEGRQKSKGKSSEEVTQGGTDFSKVNGLKPVRTRRRSTRERSPSLNQANSMYQSLRSYVGKNARLPGYMDYLHLSTADVAILKNSWSVLEDHMTRVGVEFFLDIINNHEEIRGFFRQMPNIPVYEIKANEDLNRHGMYILGTIKKIVSKIDDTEYLEKVFEELSDKHRKIGVEASGMDIFGKVFCKVMRPILLEQRKWKPEIKDSWMTLFSSIVKVMKKSETKSDNQTDVEDPDHKNDLKHQFFRRNTFDRHLIEVGCETFSQLFTHYPVLEHLASYNEMIVDGISVGEALKSHAAAIGSVLGEIQEHAGNPERIRFSLAQAGQRRYLEGVERQQLDMLGPILAHVIRPLVWERRLWSVEVEKAWTHLFDIVACLMKLGYPQEFEEDEVFPNMAEVVLLKDTWTTISRQISTIGMESFEKLFCLNSDVSVYLTSVCQELESSQLSSMSERVKGLTSVTVDLVGRVVDELLPHMGEVVGVIGRLGEDLDPNIVEVLGPVWCNTTRHFLLIQGRWSLDVENAWLSLFREMSRLLRGDSSSCSSLYPEKL